MAIATNEIGVAFVGDRGDGTLALWLQRVSPSGTLLGPQIDVASLGSGDAGVAIATDGAVYVMCGSASSFGITCATVPVGGGSPDLGEMIPLASLPELVFGAGGFLLAQLTADGLSIQPIDASARLTGAARLIVVGTGRPTLAPTDVGYVLGYATNDAWAQELDASGRPSGAPILLGAARAMTEVAVTSIATEVGAAWIDPSSEPISTIDLGPSVALAPGASSDGEVAIAPASNGLVATWSDRASFIGVAALATDRTIMGPIARIDVDGNDNPHALVAGPDGYLLITTTTPSLAPLEVVPLPCR